MSKKVFIEDEYDGFSLIITESIRSGEDMIQLSAERFRFDQEDSLEGLVEFFKNLGIEAEYKEVY